MSHSNERGSLTGLRRTVLPPVRPPETSPEMEARLLDKRLVEENAEEERRPPAETEPPSPGDPSAKSDVQRNQLAIPRIAPVNTENYQPVTKTRLPVRPGVPRSPKVFSHTVTYRLPTSLIERLRRVAEYNNVPQTAILIEALELHLPSFQQPREEGSEALSPTKTR